MKTNPSSGFSTDTLLLIAGAAGVAYYFRAQIESALGIAAAAPAGGYNPDSSPAAGGGALDPTISNDPTTLAQIYASQLAAQGYTPTQQAVAAQQAATSATVLTGPAGSPAPAPVVVAAVAPAPVAAPSPAPATSWESTAAGQAYINAPVQTASIQLPGMLAPQLISVTAPPPEAAYQDAGPIYGNGTCATPNGFMTIDQYRAWQIKALATGNYSCP
jgi:hypothetical protein